MLAYVSFLVHSPDSTREGTPPPVELTLACLRGGCRRLLRSEKLEFVIAFSTMLISVQSRLIAEGNVPHVNRLPRRLQVDVIRVVVLLGGVVAVADVEVVRAPHVAQIITQF